MTPLDPSKIKFIIFDMDGTLYPDNPEIIRHYGECAVDLLARHKNISAEEAGNLMEEVKEQLTGKLKGKPTNSLALMSAFEVSFENYAREVSSRQRIEELLRPDSQALRALECISTAWPVFLYTTNNAISADRILRAIGMDHLFPVENRFTLSHIFDMGLPRQEALGLIKPGHRGFRHILELRGFKPEETLMVGDSEVSDIRPARELGMATWTVARMDDLTDLARALGV